MDSSSEGPLHTPNPYSDKSCDPDLYYGHNSISEVGYEQVVPMWNHNIARELIRSLTKKKKGYRIKTMSFPRFNPEVADTDPIAWCSAVSLLMKDNPLQGKALYFALNHALEGSAAHLLAQIIDGEEVTWQTFNEQFIEYFRIQETAASALIKLSEAPQWENESLGEYGNRIISLLQIMWRNSTRAEMITATVLYLMSSRDRRFRQLALTSDIKSVKQFRREMKPFYEERQMSPSRRPPSGSENKRSRSLASWDKCRHYGNCGHRTSGCRKRMKLEPRKYSRRPEENRPATSSRVSCSKCLKEGRITPHCPLLRKENDHSKDNRVETIENNLISIITKYLILKEKRWGGTS